MLSPLQEPFQEPYESLTGAVKEPSRSLIRGALAKGSVLRTRKNCMKPSNYVVHKPQKDQMLIPLPTAAAAWYWHLCVTER